MKKLTAIFLLSTFMLNLFGYRAWYYFELKSAEHDMEVMLDKKDYLETDLVTIRIPLTLPYQTDTDDFERISGEFSYEGSIYKYVERKMENGYFVLRCLPDVNKMQLEAQKNRMVKSSIDQTQNNADKQSPVNHVLKYPFSEFEQNVFSLKIYSSLTLSNIFGTYSEPAFNSLMIDAPGQPPDQIS